jgi:hypothetical protein
MGPKRATLARAARFGSAFGVILIVIGLAFAISTARTAKSDLEDTRARLARAESDLEGLSARTTGQEQIEDLGTLFRGLADSYSDLVSRTADLEARPIAVQEPPSLVRDEVDADCVNQNFFAIRSGWNRELGPLLVRC